MSVKWMRQAGRWACVAVAWHGLHAQGAEPLPDKSAATNLIQSAATNSPAPASASADLLQFMDGSFLHGRLRSMSAGRSVGWEYPDVSGSIEFRPTNIAWIRFEKAKTVSAQSQPSCRFRFANGDEVFGSLTAIEEDTLQLETWFGGALKAPRQALQSIVFLSKGFSIVYEGPTSAEGWVHGKTPRTWDTATARSWPAGLARWAGI